MGQKSNLNSSSPSDLKLRQINHFRQTDNLVSSPKLDAATSLNDLDRRLDIKFNKSPKPSQRQSNQSINFQDYPKTNRVNVRTNAFNHHSVTTKDNSKMNRYASAIKNHNEDMAGLEATSQSFDFSVLDPTLNQKYAKRASMPVAAVNVQHSKKMGTSSALGHFHNNGQNVPFQIDENNRDSNSSVMNQSFGFGPLQVSRAKYGSQERNDLG